MKGIRYFVKNRGNLTKKKGDDESTGKRYSLGKNKWKGKTKWHKCLERRDGVMILTKMKERTQRKEGRRRRIKEMSEREEREERGSPGTASNVKRGRTRRLQGDKIKMRGKKRRIKVRRQRKGSENEGKSKENKEKKQGKKSGKDNIEGKREKYKTVKEAGRRKNRNLDKERRLRMLGRIGGRVRTKTRETSSCLQEKTLIDTQCITAKKQGFWFLLLKSSSPFPAKLHRT